MNTHGKKCFTVIVQEIDVIGFDCGMKYFLAVLLGFTENTGNIWVLVCGKAV